MKQMEYIMHLETEVKALQVIQINYSSCCLSHALVTFVYNIYIVFFSFCVTTSMQAEVTINSPRIRYVERQNALLRAENGSIKHKLSAYNAELMFKEGLSHPFLSHG